VSKRRRGRSVTRVGGGGARGADVLVGVGGIVLFI
jgi:hypothetical protein